MSLSQIEKRDKIYAHLEIPLLEFYFVDQNVNSLW
jgi:hypothetical protein